MLVLGWALRSGPIGIDRWFQQFRHGPAQWLLVFTDPRVLTLLLLGAAATAAYTRRWRLLAAAVLCPAVGLALEQLLKHLFGREKGGGLAYPSGHTTVMVIVLGMVVLAVGPRVWLLAVAAVYCLLGMIGQGATYHYFTDTVGALFLGTAVVCVAALAAGLDRCQPRCDPRHSDG
jgi:membrane-associated phospholipid phosphatase